MTTLSTFVVLCSLAASPASWREAKVGTQFQVFVPPNNLANTRYSSITITAQSGTVANPAVINLVDDGADGDTDDTVVGVALQKGESLVRYLRDGAVNDDGGGKWDGDYFVVSATQPVSVSLTTDSDWQHDWAPADNGLLRGTRFFLYTTGTTVSNRDVDVFSYSNGTRIELYDVTATALAASTSGIARIAPRGGTPLLQADLAEGEDTLRSFGLGRDLLAPGRTYDFIATQPVTVLFGAIDSVVPQNQARDGSGYVPGRNGAAQDDFFYFSVPHNPGLTSEQEIRIVAADPQVAVQLDGRTSGGGWASLGSWTLPRLGHADVVGPNATFFRLRTDGGSVNVYEANWMETGSPGTSDESDFVPGQFNADGTASWVSYLGPPGTQTNTTTRGTYTHLYLFSFAGGDVRVRDIDADGGIVNRVVTVPAHGYADVAIDTATWSALNRPGAGVRPYVLVEAAGALAVNMSNWNDNWMAYATSVLPLNPIITLTAPQQLVTGQQATWSGSVANVGNLALTDAVVNVTLGTSVHYVAATLAGAAPSAVTSFDGGTEVRFDVGAFAADAQLALSTTVLVTGSVSGKVLPLDVSATATSTGVTIGSSASAPSVVDNPAVCSLADFGATATERVRLDWLETAAPGVQSTVVVQRATSASGPWTTLDTRLVSGAGATVANGFLDSAVIAGTNVYYRLLATGSGGATAMAGPILAQPRDVTPPPLPTLTVRAQDRAVALTVSGSSVADFASYTLERSRSGSTGWTTLSATTSTVDLGLTNGITYLYRASATDLSGNKSATTPVMVAIPLAANMRVTDRVLGFEDMLGAGENDWDYNDFVVRTAVSETVTAGVLRAIQVDYEPLARGAGYVHQFRQALPVTGAWTAEVTVFAANAPTTVVSRTVTSGTGPLDVEIYANTRDALAPSSGTYTNTPRAQTAFVAGRTARLTVTLADTQAVPDALPGSAPWDCYLRLPYLSGLNEVHRAEFDGAVELTTTGPLAGRALDFVEEWTTGTTPSWPLEGAPMWSAFPSFAPWRQFGRAEDADWGDRPTATQVFRR